VPAKKGDPGARAKKKIIGRRFRRRLGAWTRLEKARPSKGKKRGQPGKKKMEFKLPRPNGRSIGPFPADKRLGPEKENPPSTERKSIRQKKGRSAPKWNLERGGGALGRKSVVSS